ncbi:TetR/AcrR family transcriptional regulator [Micromonospora tulbaghiae]|uniref:TetR/AcrR family transcriptional regulator n=1 Tax=Micromonospora tulbaghiae TaxID=479978 RepID=UPI0033E68B0B
MIAEAKVTRATFCRHFPGKDDLIRAYLRRVHEMDRAAVEAATPDNPSPIDRLLAVADSVARGIRSPAIPRLRPLGVVAYGREALEHPGERHHEGQVEEQLQQLAGPGVAGGRGSSAPRRAAITLPRPSLVARTSATAAESRTSAVRRPRARGRGRCRAGGRRPRGEAPRTGGGTHG